MGMKKASTENAPPRAASYPPDPDVPEEDIPTIPEPTKVPPPRTDDFALRDTAPRLVFVLPPPREAAKQSEHEPLVRS